MLSANARSIRSRSSVVLALARIAAGSPKALSRSGPTSSGSAGGDHLARRPALGDSPLEERDGRGLVPAEQRLDRLRARGDDRLPGVDRRARQAGSRAAAADRTGRRRSGRRGREAPSRSRAGGEWVGPAPAGSASAVSNGPRSVSGLQTITGRRPAASRGRERVGDQRPSAQCPQGLRPAEPSPPATGEDHAVLGSLRRICRLRRHGLSLAAIICP